ncbi:MAG: tetratricopeptide (TPR) repeat protein [Crocinitomicaceae bacterium]|jgi:tetratricopeptide (TPR) repeat protein
MRFYSLLLVIIFSWSFQVTGQSSEDQKLTSLNDAAFIALEKSDTAVARLANELLAESAKKGKPSVFGINAHTILGIINKDKGYFITSLNHYLKALNQAESIGDHGRISACYNNIGTVYQLQNNYVKSRSYFEKSLLIEDSLKQPLQQSIRYYNLGEVYAKMDSFSMALSYYNNSLIIEKDLGNTEGEIYALLGISEIYIKVGRYPDAQILLDEIDLKIEPHQVEESILYRKLLGILFAKKDQLDDAYRELNSAESISSKSNIRIHLLDIYKEQIAILKRQNKWETAVQKFDQYTALKDELNNLKVKNQLEDLTFQNELSRKELELKLIQEEKDLAVKNQKLEENTSKHRRKVVWFLVSSILLLFVLIIFGIRKLAKDT